METRHTIATELLQAELAPLGDRIEHCGLDHLNATPTRITVEGTASL